MNLDSQNFSRQHLEKISEEEREILLLEMSNVLTQNISDALFDQNITQVIEELRKIGHDLWSFDNNDDFQSWCGDWSKTENIGKLVLEFTKNAPVKVSWNNNL